MSFVSWRVNDLSVTNYAPMMCAEVTATLSGFITQDGRDNYVSERAMANELEAKLLGNTSVTVERTKLLPKVNKVIFSNPATIILWSDNTKSVVKCQNGEPFDPEKGFTLAYLKKLLGNKNEFNKEIHKWVKYEEPIKEEINLHELLDTEPLTLNQLMRMDGREVYVVSLDEYGAEDHLEWYSGWRTVDVNRHRVSCADGFYNFESLGKGFGFNAYLKEKVKD